jgi:6-phosphogluconate dehydrogenase
MEIGLIGLGKMGFNLALNLKNHNHKVIAFDILKNNIDKISKEGIEGAYSIQELTEKLPQKKVIWIMIPAGKPVLKVVEELIPHLHPGDIIIDGGNSNYKDTIKLSDSLKQKGIDLIDCGTSGGTNGALQGICAMIGGDKQAYQYCKEMFKDISIENGCLYTGKSGSGHFVKMVHNGIEYGMMQAIAEGFEVLSKSGFDINYQEVAKVWNHGSVISSWLMELVEKIFRKDANLDGVKGVMYASGEGKWTVETAMELDIPTPVIALSVMMRQRSRQEDTFSGKIVAALRNEFGGHYMEKAEKNLPG